MSRYDLRVRVLGLGVALWRDADDAPREAPRLLAMLNAPPPHPNAGPARPNSSPSHTAECPLSHSGMPPPPQPDRSPRLIHEHRLGRATRRLWVAAPASCCRVPGRAT